MKEQLGVGLAIGAGCAATRRFIEAEILPRFGNVELGELEDSSVVPGFCGELLVTTDSYVVDPPVFPGGDIGLMSVAGTVNDLIASGSRPLCMTMSLVLSEGFPLASLRQILDSAALAARIAGLRIVGGDTKVIEEASGLGICINATGIGTSVRGSRRFRLKDARSGDQIIISGTAGDHAMAVISAREGLGFDQRVKSDCAALNDLILPILDEVPGIHALRDPTRGGVSGALYELSQATQCRVRVNIKALPVNPEVRFGAEMLGLEPIELENEGKMLMILDPLSVDTTLRKLQGHPLGRDAAVIGEVGEPSCSPLVTAINGVGGRMCCEIVMALCCRAFVDAGLTYR